MAYSSGAGRLYSNSEPHKAGRETEPGSRCPPAARTPHEEQVSGRPLQDGLAAVPTYLFILSLELCVVCESLVELEKHVPCSMMRFEIFCGCGCGCGGGDEILKASNVRIEAMLVNASKS